MGGGGVPRGGPPNQTAYYVALVSILFLILLLCCYFCYFFISKIRELSQEDTLTTTSSNQTRPAAYPVQPVIRDSATAMAALCKQVPPTTGRGGTIFPTSTSPAALQTGGEMPPLPPQLAPPLLGQDKLPVPQPPPAASEIDARRI